MKIVSNIRKSVLEQFRNFWILLLTIICAPFFVLVYHLISESSVSRIDVVVINDDRGTEHNGEYRNYGTSLIEDSLLSIELSGIPIQVEQLQDKQEAEQKLRNKQADLLLILPPDFSEKLFQLKDSASNPVPVEFEGDLTSSSYLLAAIWIGEELNQFIYSVSGIPNPVEFRETSLGLSGSVSDFDIAVPGLMIFAIVMLMFSASIAIVNETERGTIQRIRMAPVSSFEFLTGISVVQIMLGLLSILITLAVAAAFGFQMHGSFLIVLLVAVLCSTSIIAFSLILAALCKTANQILVIGNFPLFIFMFFTGSMFPIHMEPLFTILGYPFAINGILSPVHAISALNKILIMGEGLGQVLPELVALLILTLLYFGFGVWLFNLKQLRRA